jgi:hypothetical protein
LFAGRLSYYVFALISEIAFVGMIGRMYAIVWKGTYNCAEKNNNDCTGDHDSIARKLSVT